MAHGISGAEPRPELFGYRIESELARGGQSVVYRAEQLTTGQRVAIKVLHAEARWRSRSARDRFAREIEIAGSLQHAGIVRVYDSLKLDDGRDVIVMELVDGVPLDQWLAGEPDRNPEHLIELLAEVADAVHHAHQHGVIHRDLKPTNILVDADRRAHLLDFGVARWVEGHETDSNITGLGGFAGTLAYASPEQVTDDGAPLDVRSDVYSLGVIGFEMLTGSMPYGLGNSLSSAIRSITTAVPDESLRPAIGTDLWMVLGKALAKHADRRYQSAADLARDLRRAAAGHAVEARSDSTWYMLRMTARRHRTTLALFLTTLAGLAGMTLVLAIGNARLNESLRRSHLTQIHAYTAAGEREHAEAVLWQQFDRFVPIGIAASEQLWTAPPAQRQLLWAFVEMQAKATCLRVEPAAAARTMGVTEWAGGGFALVTPAPAIRWLDPHGSNGSSTLPIALPTNTQFARVTPSGGTVVVGTDRRLIAIDANSRAQIASFELPEHFVNRFGFVVTDWAVGITATDGPMLVLTLPSFDHQITVSDLMPRQVPWLDPSETVIAYLSIDGQLTVRDLHGTSKTHPLNSPLVRFDGKAVFSQVLLSPSRSVAIIAHGGTITAWPLEPKASTPTLLSNAGYRMSVASDPSWSILSAAAHGDSALHLWRTADWQQLPSLRGHARAVTSRAFSPEGDRILTTDTLGTLRVWSAPGRGWKRTLGERTDVAHGFALGTGPVLLYCPDEAGNLVALDDRGSVRQTCSASELGSNGFVRIDACSNSDWLAAAGLDDQIVMLHDLAAGETSLASTRLGPGQHIADIAFRPSRNPGTQLAACTTTGRLVLIDIETMELVSDATIQPSGVPSDLAWSADGSSLLVTLRDGRAIVLNAPTLTVRSSTPITARQLRCAAASPDGRSFAVAGDSGRVSILDAATGDLRTSDRLSEQSLFAIAWHPSGTTLAVGNRSGTITLIDAVTLELLASFEAEGAVMAMHFTTDGAKLLTAVLGSAVQQWDFAQLADTLDAVRVSTTAGH